MQPALQQPLQQELADLEEVERLASLEEKKKALWSELAAWLEEEPEASEDVHAARYLELRAVRRKLREVERAEKELLAQQDAEAAEWVAASRQRARNLRQAAHVPSDGGGLPGACLGGLPRGLPGYRRYYQQERRRAGSYFRWLGLTQEQAGGRGGDTLPMALQQAGGRGAHNA